MLVLLGGRFFPRAWLPTEGFLRKKTCACKNQWGCEALRRPQTQSLALTLAWKRAVGLAGRAVPHAASPGAGWDFSPRTRAPHPAHPSGYLSWRRDGLPTARTCQWCHLRRALRLFRFYSVVVAAAWSLGSTRSV